MDKTPSLLFLFGTGVISLADGQPPYSPYSHNSHLFLIAHEGLRMGWRVFFRQHGHDECVEIKQLYPMAQMGSVVPFSNAAFRPDIAFYVNSPGLMTDVRIQKPDCIGAFILNAHFWLENSAGYGVHEIELWRQGFGNDVDFVLTQNPRMIDLGFSLISLMAKWQWRDRFLIAPNTYTPENLAAENAQFNRAEVRAEMGLADDNIAIINSGGPWSWTDAPTFLEAFAEAVRQGATRLKFFQMGIIQDNNLTEKQTEENFRMFMVQNFDLIESGNLVVNDNWQAASACLPRYNYGADVGLNVSKESVENYQAHRVRFIDYAKAGLPALQTTGSYYGDTLAHAATIPVVPGDVQSYVDALMRLNNGEIDLAAKRRTMRDFSESIVSTKFIPDALRTMMQMGRLPQGDRDTLRNGLYALYYSSKLDNFENHFKPADPEMEKFIHQHFAQRPVKTA